MRWSGFSYAVVCWLAACCLTPALRAKQSITITNLNLGGSQVRENWSATINSAVQYSCDGNCTWVGMTLESHCYLTDEKHGILDLPGSPSNPNFNAAHHFAFLSGAQQPITLPMTPLACEEVSFRSLPEDHMFDHTCWSDGAATDFSYRGWGRGVVRKGTQLIHGIHDTTDRSTRCTDPFPFYGIRGQLDWRAEAPVPEIFVRALATENGMTMINRRIPIKDNQFDFGRVFREGWSYELSLANPPGEEPCFISNRQGTIGTEDVVATITCNDPVSFLYKVCGLADGERITLRGTVDFQGHIKRAESTTGNRSFGILDLEGIVGGGWQGEIANDPTGRCSVNPPDSGTFDDGAAWLTVSCAARGGLGKNDACGLSTVGVRFSNLLGGNVGVVIDATLPDSSTFSEEIDVSPNNVGTFSQGFPPGTTFSLRVTSQPPPPGELFTRTTCSLPSGPMTVDNNGTLVEGECENAFGGFPRLCDVLPELCLVFAEDPIHFTCFGFTLVFQVRSRNDTCDVVCPMDPSEPCPPPNPNDCNSVERIHTFRRDFLFCDFNGIPLTTMPEKVVQSYEFDGPWAALDLADGGQPVSGAVHVTGFLIDPDVGIDAAHFLIDGQLVTLDHFETDLPSNDLCDDWPSDSGPCVENSRFSGFLDTRGLADGDHVLELVGVNNANPQGFSLISREFTVDNGGGGGCGGDTTLPAISLTAPLDGAVLEPGTVLLSATAADASGIERVTFFVDDVRVGSPDFSAPYSQEWIATPGEHTVRARAKDNCGNVRWTPYHHVTIDDGGGDPCTGDVNGPTVSVTAPVSGSTHPPGNLAIAATANDPNDVEKVRFYVDGSLLAEDFDAPYSTTWIATEGGHAIQARATDLCGNESVSAPIPITIAPADPCNGDNAGPTVTITSPANGAELPLGSHLIQANAADVNGVQRIEFYVDGSLKSADTSAPYSYLWNATLGNHSLQVRAFDSCGNSRWSSNISVSVVSSDPCDSDASGPAISLTAPANGATLDAGNVNLSASASDANGVESVQFYVDGSIVGIDFSAPYSKTWNATLGNHTLHAEAVDLCGNTAATAPISVTVVEPDPCDDDSSGPAVTITSPANGAELTPGSHLISANATDASGVQRVELYVDGVLSATDTSAPYSYNWNATLGPHSLQVRAFDSCGNSRWSSSISVSVVSGDPCDSDASGPTISLTAPANGATLDAGNVNLSANANDANGVESVLFYVDGSIVGVDFGAPYSKTWNAPLGNHTLHAEAIDLCGNTAATAPISVTVIEPDPCDGDSSGPTVAITEPGHNTLHEPGTVTIQANANDPGGVLKVEFYVDDVLAATDTTAPYSWFWANGTIGWHQLKVRAFDNCGNSRWSAVIDVELGPIGPDDPPL